MVGFFLGWFCWNFWLDFCLGLTVFSVFLWEGDGEEKEGFLPKKPMIT